MKRLVIATYFIDWSVITRFFKQEDSHAQENVTPVRRHYATTEEKIQQEFREMQQREEELRYLNFTHSSSQIKTIVFLLDLHEASCWQNRSQTCSI